jgi:cellobiose-specific phosphotransferase system component IIA
MPILQNPRHEAFAQARAKGALMDDAYESAGFAPGNGHASRLAKQPEMIERVAELRAQQADANDANAQAVIAELIRMAKAGEALKTPAGVKEARINLLEAHRLADTLAKTRRGERNQMLGLPWFHA